MAAAGAGPSPEERTCEDYVGHLRSVILALRSRFVPNFQGSTTWEPNCEASQIIPKHQRPGLRNRPALSAPPSQKGACLSIGKAFRVGVADVSARRRRSASLNGISHGRRSEGLCSVGRPFSIEDLQTSTLFTKTENQYLFTVLKKKFMVLHAGTVGGESMNSAAWPVAMGAVLSGELTMRLADLADRLIAGGMTLPAAVAELRGSLKTGALRIYGMVPAALNGDVFGVDLSYTNVANMLKSLGSHVSPSCSRLSWPLLRGVLRAFHTSCVRPTLDLVLETCHGAFNLDCDVLDVLVAVASSPLGVCDIEVAPWPLAELPSDSNGCVSTAPQRKRLLESVVLVLHDPVMEGSRPTENGERDHNALVFPAYSPLYASATEAASFGKAAAKTLERAEAWLKDVQMTSSISGEVLSLPVLFAHVGSLKSTTKEQLTVGTLLWVWEKIVFHARARAGDGAGSGDERGEPRGAAAQTVRPAAALAAQHPAVAKVGEGCVTAPVSTPCKDGRYQ